MWGVKLDVNMNIYKTEVTLNYLYRTMTAYFADEGFYELQNDLFKIF